ncbi:protein MpGID1L6 [Marchantia polymorpha subsp. ruderalis]|uniref:Alpha/beta hydrolase fold-3 domain-containing protein n=2 Tax=Marchantia polymorpha TaxID=3197 RepID=A0A176VKH8_MARPO|nr:hypothetical protein AXG93_3256s1500 [Marchantia polymorpha subsp. ruderalis]PTQ43223.1 hypothetical protein MARPO_0026s0096 [Marchantia polymorpha]PTQ43225.1 hypothetical protein MARPO_0026s0098 [Marchantia polymorpha]BBN02095.1 hypothetical protein Mp_2g12730 [Marchantia polymorpha subsp. ruderalis]|eukprot:PTQ43223.1 hypothetical protein MARPO_0026s0096 [Marchantia polymorpha]
MDKDGVKSKKRRSDERGDEEACFELASPSAFKSSRQRRGCGFLLVDRLLSLVSSKRLTEEVPVSNTKLTIPLGLKVVGEVIKRLNSITRRSDGTINRALADLLELKIAACEKPTNGVSTRDVVIDEATNVWVRIFTPEIVRPGSNSSSEEKVPVMVYYHGGGFGVLCANMLFYDRIGRTLAKTCQMIVVSVNYRRAPEHKFPIAYDDSFQALEWLRSPASARHLPAVADVSRTFLCGDSAGGNIVHFMGCRAAEIDLSPVQIRGLIPLQPYLGSEARVPSEINLVNVPVISVDATDWHWKAFLPEGADRDHPACNVFGPNAKDISGLNLPPMFVVVSTLDVLLDHQLHYVAKMQELGKDVTMKCYDGGIHGFYILEGVGIKLALTCIDDIHNFVQSCLLTVAAQ